MSWLLDLIYVLTLLAVSPVLAWRMAVHGKYRTGWKEKFLGRVPPRAGNRPCI